jgi:DNA repair exonuclease SbcCD nuclease subunit
MYEAIVSSDWHLGKLERFFPHDHIERQILELHKPFKYAIEHGVKNVVIPGDVSDTPHMEEQAIRALANLIYEYDSVLNITYIAGNHDFADSKKTSMDLLALFAKKKAFKNFRLYLKPEQVVEEGLVINYLPFPCNESLKSSKPCLNYAHIERVGALMDNGRPSRMRSEHDFKCPTPDYTVSGHLHTYQELKESRTLFVGATTQVKFDDSPKKGFVHLKARYKEGKLLVKHEFIDSRPNFVLRRKIVETQKDWESVKLDSKSIYEIRLGDGVIAPQNIRTECPNIFSIVGSSKKVEQLHEEVKAHSKMPMFTPTTGLKSYLVRQGLDKKERIFARSEVKKAMNQLGL